MTQDPNTARGEDAGQIFEVTVAVTVLVDAEDQQEARQQVDEAGLEGLSYEIDEGGWLGQSRIIDVTPLPRERLLQRQQELGSDGTFFPAAPSPKVYDAEAAVLRLQISQGWSSETMSMLMHGFLRDTGLLGVFADRLRVVADHENTGLDTDDSLGL